MQEESFITLLIQGHYSDWIFNIFLTNVTVGVKNNLALLLLFATSLKKLSKYTETKIDDKISNWLIKKLTGFGKTKLARFKK